MKKVVVLICFTLLLLSCDPSVTSDSPGWLEINGSQSLLDALEGNWTITRTIFDFGTSNEDDYIYLIFDSSGTVPEVKIADATMTVFEGNQISRFSDTSVESSGMFEVTLTEQTDDPEFIGSVNYWTYEIPGSNIIIDVFNEQSLDTRFVEFNCVK